MNGRGMDVPSYIFSRDIFLCMIIDFMYDNRFYV